MRASIGPSSGSFHKNLKELYDISRYTAPAVGTLGNLSRNTLWVPMIRQANVSFIKEFPINERKPLDPQHWKYRYAHTYRPPRELHAIGATVNNIHQGILPNMYINYPFLNLDLLIPYISESHSLGMKVKIYYTMRELTTRLPELWIFRSLHHEIYRTGGTQGQGNQAPGALAASLRACSRSHRDIGRRSACATGFCIHLHAGTGRKSVAAVIVKVIDSPEIFVRTNLGVDKPSIDGDKPAFL